jgi:hypothetical protein
LQCLLQKRPLVLQLLSYLKRENGNLKKYNTRRQANLFFIRIS